MHAAQVKSFGSAPVYGDVADLAPPGPNQIRLKILGAGVHRIVQARAAGKHFSATTVPLDPSADGVGVDESTGQRYYIGTFAAACFAEYANVDRARVFPIDESADPIAVAALTNPIVSSWMALSERVVDLPKGFTVLILGVTGTSGRTAVDVARTFGAGKVIGIARNEAAIKKIQGLDGYVVQKEPVEDSDFASVGHVDVILDYVYGKAASALLAALKPERETQYVNIGTVGSEETIALPAQLLRSKMLRMTGSAPGSWTIAALGAQMPAMLEFAAKLARPADVFTKPLKEVESAWDSDEARKKRMVMVP